ncbi:MAG: hypothetical protein KA267_12845 [Gemmatimonadales bacterium]|nr:hypothetical protein [Gemmatimonadales bacterium]MBP6572460.1 hypothetical protein [Gemmatimonadales bacterium]
MTSVLEFSLHSHALLLALLGGPSSPTTMAPTCGELLAGLRAKTEANYAGFRLEARGARQKAYLTMLAPLERRAATLAEAACFPVLFDYLDWFHDPHLFVYQSPRLDSAETRRVMPAVPRIAVDVEAMRRSIGARGAKVDPIEGLWYDGAMEIAVIPDPAGKAGRFVGVVVTSDTVTLPIGSVRAVFDRTAAGSYTASLRWRSLAVTIPPVSLHRGGTVLRLSPGIWGKRFPGAAVERALLDSVDVHRPTFTWRANVGIISVLSHDGQYRRLIDSMVAANAARLATSDAFLIDLRGNEGGGSQTTAALTPYVMAETPPSAAEDFGEAVMLSSPDQISYAKRAFGAPTSAFVTRLVAALEASPGELVPLEAPGSPAPPRVQPRPASRVAVLVDRGTVSAAEVITLTAKREGRAPVIGQPTAGALDYQSTSVVRVHPEHSRWYLGYPTITAHRRLPEGGMRGKGIAPDIRLDWEGVADPVAAVLAKLPPP